MSFMEPQVEHGQWYKVDGPCGTEYVPADLVATLTIRKPDGSETVKQPTLDDLQEMDRMTGVNTEGKDNDGVRFPLPSALRDYCENREAWSITLIEGWGARLSAPGYLDCMGWAVFETQHEAEAYLQEQYGED